MPSSRRTLVQHREQCFVDKNVSLGQDSRGDLGAQEVLVLLFESRRSRLQRTGDMMRLNQPRNSLLSMVIAAADALERWFGRESRFLTFFFKIFCSLAISVKYIEQC